MIYDIGCKKILNGDKCHKSSQLRPHIVWFGEDIHYYDKSIAHIASAGRILVIGTSLAVYPAAGMLKFARYHSKKIIVSLDVDKKPYGYSLIKTSATQGVPAIVKRWLDI